MFIINFCLNMFQASLCPSSGEQRPCVIAYGVLRWFCWMWLVAVVHNKSQDLQDLGTYCGFISCIVLLWFDVCWCYGVVRLGWCGILMQVEALVLQPDVTCFIISLFTLNMFRMLVHPSSGACDLLWIYFMCCIALV